jgi:acetylornithine deacetylase/succinyl-diaminopimelate desuccinylase-like protein
MLFKIKRSEIDEVNEHYTSEINKKKIIQTIFNLQSMTERASWKTQNGVSDYLKRWFDTENLQYKTEIYYHDNKIWENIIVPFPGNRYTENKFLITAHYDSKNWIKGHACPGADDNGSGVALLLEIAKRLKKISHSITFELVFFSNEEFGRHGSKNFAKYYREKGEKIIAVLNVDSVAYNKPFAIFSEETLIVLTSKFSAKRKIKMILKMSYNLFATILNGSKELKIVYRKLDEHLIPDKTELIKMGLERIKFIENDKCI